MKIRRRDFIKAAGGIALGSAAGSLTSLASAQESSPAVKPRVAVFFEADFPSEDGLSMDRSVLERAFAGYDTAFLGLNDLMGKLDAALFELLVLPYGSTFPKDAWGAMNRYLVNGGNWLNLGGVPFSVPVAKSAAGWRKEIAQAAYHKQLGITQAFPVSAADITSYQDAGAFEGLTGVAGELKAREIHEFYVRFTITKDFPDEDGTGGARDAVLHPIVFGLDKDGKKLAAPVIQIDRLQGDYAGGRWVLTNFAGSLTVKGVRTLADVALQGALEFTVRPSFASFFEGELPSLTVQVRRPKGDVEKVIGKDCTVELQDENGKRIESIKVPMRGTGIVSMGTATSNGKRQLAPGLYRIAANLNLKASDSSVSTLSGFWIHDERLMGSGRPLGLDGNYLLRDGKPYPVTGTTYMISDVHRKFLLEPNAYLWDKDFADMKLAGINMVRTGIWTAWKNFMLDVGAPNEGALRALDAFVLTARKHDIPVIFTFFAFLPEMWGGENAFLDPRSINAQKEFVSALALRFGRVNDIAWDLINEPSFCSPDRLWSCRPNYDRFESAAWEKWLKEQVRADDDHQRTSLLQERYRSTASESSSLPSLEDFADANIFGDHRPVKVVDYRLFAQEMFRLWIDHMTSAIRGNGNTHQLITVGQDEGGTGDRPNPQFYNDRVDFTSIHNWWFNDDLVWDNVLTKVPGKPNLVEETGVMFYEKMDGSAWRSEGEAAELLERKLAISLGAGGAGFIEWVWNTNPFMKSDNEAAIGLLRADGTAKPELRPVVEYARFFAAQKHLMTGKREEEVVMVIPHSNMFSTRNAATQATQRCVRTLSYDCTVPVRAISEYRLKSLHDIPRLLVLPSPRVFNEPSWQALIDLVEKGATLLVTGVIDADEHWYTQPRLKTLGIDAMTKPVAQEEFLTIDAAELRLSYRGDKIQRLEKAVPANGGKSEVVTVERGNGRILWSPLPVELSDTSEPLTHLYQYALKKAGISPVCEVVGTNAGVLVAPTVFENAVLYALVSECSKDSDVRFIHKESNSQIRVEVKSQRTALVFVDRKSGNVLAQLG